MLLAHPWFLVSCGSSLVWFHIFFWRFRALCGSKRPVVSHCMWFSIPGAPHSLWLHTVCGSFSLWNYTTFDLTLRVLPHYLWFHTTTIKTFVVYPLGEVPQSPRLHVPCGFLYVLHSWGPENLEVTHRCGSNQDLWNNKYKNERNKISWHYPFTSKN
jgi:hypothetical protein